MFCALPSENEFGPLLYVDKFEELLMATLEVEDSKDMLLEQDGASACTFHIAVQAGLLELKASKEIDWQR